MVCSKEAEGVLHLAMHSPVPNALCRRDKCGFFARKQSSSASLEPAGDST